MAAEATVGRYQVLTLLGKGGMGAVYKARDTTTGAEVALKVLTVEGHELTEAKARFEREVQAQARLTHESIVRVLESGVAPNGLPWAALELVGGGDLASDLGSDDVDLRRRIELLRDSARGVAHAHSLGIVHRDLKPQNILIGLDGRARVSDFGLARILDRATRLTREGQVIGTPLYLSPEQSAGREAGPPTDVHALGAMLYQAIVGEPPFQASGSSLRLFAMIEQEPPPDPAAKAKELGHDAPPRDLATIALAALAKDPTSRPTASDVADDLDRWLRGEPVRARRPRAPRSAKKTVLLAGAAVVAILAVASIIIVVKTPRDPEGRPILDSGADARERAAVATRALDALSSAVEARGKTWEEPRAQARRAVTAALDSRVAALAGAPALEARFAALDGEAAWVRGDLDQARVARARVLDLARLDPTAAAHGALLGALLDAEEGDAASALATIDALPKPAPARAVLARALALARTKHASDGLVELAAAEKAGLQDPPRRAVVLIAAGSLDKAAAALAGVDKARLRPVHAAAILADAKRVLEQGNLDHAETLVDRACDAARGSIDKDAGAPFVKAALDASLRATTKISMAKPGELQAAYRATIRPFKMARRVDPTLPVPREVGFVAASFGNFTKGFFQALAEGVEALGYAMEALPDEQDLPSNLAHTAVKAHNMQQIDLETTLAAIARARASLGPGKIRLDVDKETVNLLKNLAPRRQQALELAEKLLVEAPDDVEIQTVRAEILIEIGRVVEGRVALDNAIQHDPGSGMAHQVRGNLIIKLDDASELETAWQDFRVASEDLRQTVLQRDIALERMAVIDERRENYARALELVERRARSERGESSPACVLHARILARLGRKDDAVARLERGAKGGESEAERKDLARLAVAVREAKDPVVVLQR